MIPDPEEGGARIERLHELVMISSPSVLRNVLTVVGGIKFGSLRLVNKDALGCTKSESKRKEQLTGRNSVTLRTERFRLFS